MKKGRALWWRFLSLLKTIWAIPLVPHERSDQWSATSL